MLYGVHGSILLMLQRVSRKGFINWSDTKGAINLFNVNN